MQIRGLLCAVMTAVILPHAPEPAAQSNPATEQPALPTQLDSYLTTYVRLPSARRRLLLSGAPVTALLDTNARQEVAVFGATWIDALPSVYVQQFSDIENFERGSGFRVTRRMSDPPRLEDFASQYPKATLPSSSSFLYWQEVQFGLKPTIRINHVVIEDRPDAIVVASKLLYASHYFWTALEVRVLLSDPARGRGFWFVNVSRSRSDGLTGFGGRFVRGRVESEAQKGILALLQNTKLRLEQ